MDSANGIRLQSSVGGDTSCAALEKSQDLGNLISARFIFQFAQRLLNVVAGEIYLFIGMFDCATGFGRKTCPTQTYAVNAGNPGRVAVADRIGRNVFDDLGAAGDHRPDADIGELMDGNQTGDEGVVFDGDVTGQY